MAFTVDLQRLRSDVLNIVNDTGVSRVYSDDFVDEALNEVQIEVCAEWKWQFLRNKKIFLGAQSVGLAQDLNVGDTSMVLNDVTNFETSGAVWIDQDIVFYTNAATTTVTGVSGQTVTHLEGAEVRPLILVPDDYGSMPEVHVKRSTNGKYYPLSEVDEINFDNPNVGLTSLQQKFSILNVNSSTAPHEHYLRVGYMSNDDQFVFWYNKLPELMVDDTDVCSIPDRYARSILPKLAAARLMFLRNDNVDGLGESLLAQAERAVFKMKKHYGEREQGLSKMMGSTYQSGTYRYAQNRNAFTHE